VGLGEGDDEGGWVEVEGFVPGMAAINSCAIFPRDRVLAIDGELFKPSAAADTEHGAGLVQRATKMLLGKRGSKVKLLLQRESGDAALVVGVWRGVGGGGGGWPCWGGGGGGGGGKSVVELTLKRGAWSVEHAVLEEERRDMLDLSRWPTPLI